MEKDLDFVEKLVLLGNELIFQNYLRVNILAYENALQMAPILS